MKRLVLPLLGLTTLIATSTLAARPAGAGELTSAGAENLVALHLEVAAASSPIHGLTAADFEVREKGKKVSLVDVVEVGEEAGAGTYPEAWRRQVLLLFDLELSGPAQFLRALDLAQEVISAGLPVGTRIAVATHRPGVGLQLELGPTSVDQEVTEVLEALRLEQSEQLGGAAAGPLITAEDLVTSRARGTEAAKGRVQHQQGRIMRFVRSLAGLQLLAREVPGGSQVLVFSEGFDSGVILGNPATQRLDQAWSTAQSEAAARGDIAAVNTATRHGGGVVETALFETLSSYEKSGCPIHAIRLESGADSPSPEKGGRGPNGLVIITEKTEGRLVAEAEDAGRSIGRLLQPLGSTYLLVFAPPTSAPKGRYRKLDIKLEYGEGDVALSAPPGYYETRSVRRAEN